MVEEKHRELVTPSSGMEPVAILHDDGCWTMKRGESKHRFAGRRRMEVYSADQLAQVQRESEMHANNAALFADELTRVERERDELLEALKTAQRFCGQFTADECLDSVAIPINEAISKLEGMKP